jgi:hypothetical protein
VCTVPAGKGGYHLIAASVKFQSSSGWAVNELAYLRLYKNSVDDVFLHRLNMHATGTFEVFLCGGALINLAAGDTLSVRVRQESGGSLSIDGNGYPHSSHVAIALLF